MRLEDIVANHADDTLKALSITWGLDYWALLFARIGPPGFRRPEEEEESESEDPVGCEGITQSALEAAGDYGVPTNRTT